MTTDPFRLDGRRNEIPPHHLRLETLQSIRTRLEILDNESAVLDAAPNEKISAAVEEYLLKLRASLQSFRTDYAMLVAQCLLKSLETELQRRGICPDEHIEWVLSQVEQENLVG